MLGNINLADKSYEELIREAVEKIPLYTNEWTNFNMSDPGITILQNLSAFTMLQQSRINEVTEEIRLRLLEMLGYQKSEFKAASVLLVEEKNRALKLTAGEKLSAGGLCFETEEPVDLTSWGIKAVYTLPDIRESVYKDITYLLERSVKTSAYAFGKPVKNNSAIYFVFDKFPQEELLMSVQVKDEGKRNPFGEENIIFADIIWQCFTENGWTNVEASDETRGFLLSGVIKIKLPENPLETSVFTQSGYVLRCVLKNNCYDIPPRISCVSVNLIEVIQKDTKAKSFCFDDPKNVVLKHRMADYGYFTVYGREAGDKYYRAYKPYTAYTKEEQGRFYLLSVLSDGSYRFDFDPERFGNAPEQGADSIRIICYNDETIHHYKAGRVEGYENQIIDLEQLERVLPDEFCLLAEDTDDGGEKRYFFIEPGNINPDELCYTVISGKGQLKITEPGLADDCRLFLSDCAVTAGASGNIIAGNKFIPVPQENNPPPPCVFINPSAGENGITAETGEELRLRFLKDIKNASAAVTPADYEKLAMETPGYCIHKVKAVYCREKNVMRLAVKPYTGEERPTLSGVHIKHIGNWLDSRRMITSKIELCRPVYVPIDLQAKIYVKSYFENARNDIEKFISQALDGVTTDVPFGAAVSYNHLFRGLEDLPCVDSLYELKISTRDRQNTYTEGADIIMNDDALYYEGRINLEIIIHPL
ncbi:MAG: baseplate J/gp47 family protein [Oscillospiraceae bacterium]|nr:baseplate J/gp47 family protein [Oscillospiraceae bacterium]